MSPALNGSSAIRRFERGDAIEIRDGITFDFYTGLPHVLWVSIVLPQFQHATESVCWDMYLFLCNRSTERLQFQSQRQSALHRQVATKTVHQLKRDEDTKWLNGPEAPSTKKPTKLLGKTSLLAQYDLRKICPWAMNLSGSSKRGGGHIFESCDI